MWLDLKLVFLTVWVVGFSNSRLPEIILRYLPSHPMFNPGKLLASGMRAVQGSNEATSESRKAVERIIN